MIYLFVLIVCFCSSVCQQKQDSSIEVANEGTKLATVEFSFSIDQEVYLYTIHGEAPQIAIWLEYPDSSFYRTVWVTHRAGKNDWVGKIECQVALPFWKYRKNSIKNKYHKDEKTDTVTGATPKQGPFTVSVKIPGDKRWIYYIEVNASGDYNENFPYWSAAGLPDSEGNGQPSIIYSGDIIGGEGRTNIPYLLGRTDQWSSLPRIFKDIDKLTTAKGLITNLKVTSLKK